MEALTGFQVTLLTIYDMCKAINKRMVMTNIHLVEKTGRKSGDFSLQERIRSGKNDYYTAFRKGDIMKRVAIITSSDSKYAEKERI